MAPHDDSTLRQPAVPHMNDQDFQHLVRVLEEIRDNQKLQLQQQAEAQAIAKKQSERNERIQDRAEQIQNKSAQLIAGSRKALSVILPIITLLILYLSWLLFHRVIR